MRKKNNQPEQENIKVMNEMKRWRDEEMKWKFHAWMSATSEDKEMSEEKVRNKNVKKTLLRKESCNWVSKGFN